MQSIAPPDIQSALAEVFQGQLPPEIAHMMKRRDTSENIMRELLTGVPAETREAIAALHDLHQEEMRMLLEVIRELHAST